MDGQLRLPQSCRRMQTKNYNRCSRSPAEGNPGWTADYRGKDVFSLEWRYCHFDCRLNGAGAELHNHGNALLIFRNFQ